ncbi:MAG: hypothetical protein K2Y39_14440 [Candidatus Obscuribacterales bacterium]|nr:hypothetical protein [Candidatus Obscuribacterales bacterium]
MLAHRSRVRRRRTNRGAGISEFGPGILILVICIFFPLVDLLSVCLSYCTIMVLNYNQVAQAALVRASEAANPDGDVKKGIPDTWRNGMGRFVNMSGNVDTDVSYRSGQQESGQGATDAQDVIVRVKTTITCNPFLPIPFFVGVPGINAPFPLVVSQEKQMENPDFSQQ